MDVIRHFHQEFQDLLEKQDPVAVKLVRSFVRCPPEQLGIDGEPFLMGSPKSESSWTKQSPVHPVVVSPFRLQATPVTRRQYRLYDARHERKVTDPVGARGDYDRHAPDDECPMIHVSWYDACVFAGWVGGRLPTEAEWEYACRAGTTTAWCCEKEEELVDYAWYGENAGSGTQPVGVKRTNAWGLHDMHGSVWEWCHDWFDADYYRESPRVDPQGPTEATYRVHRGGSWLRTAENCESSLRGRGEPAIRTVDLGFRVAAVPAGKSSQEQVKQAEPGA